ETEWLATVAGSPTEPVPYERTLAVVGALVALPGGSRITFEPGGQVELSGPPAATCGDAARAMATDVATLGPRLCAAAIALAAAGTDRHRAPARVVDTTRYRAMESYFDAAGCGVAGRTMMCRTASLQVNVGHGDGDGSMARR